MLSTDAFDAFEPLFPVPADVRRILRRLRTEPDRSAAIVSAAIVEGFLAKLIARCVADSGPQIAGKMFCENGPLFGFGSKVLIGVAFKVISNRDGDEMSCIEAIRNLFASSGDERTFSCPAVTDLLARSGLVTSLKASALCKSYNRKIGNKEWFLLAVGLCCLNMNCSYQELCGPIVTPTRVRAAGSPNVGP